MQAGTKTGAQFSADHHRRLLSSQLTKPQPSAIATVAIAKSAYSTGSQSLSLSLSISVVSFKFPQPTLLPNADLCYGKEEGERELTL